MIKKKELSSTHLRTKGFKKIEIIWNTEIAVFRTQRLKNGANEELFTLANPTDWYWLTSGGMISDKIYEQEKVSHYELELEKAALIWQEVQEAALLTGTRWLNKPYLELAQKEYTDVYVRNSSSPFIITQHCGVQVMPSGQFLSHLLNPYDKKFVCEKFAMTLDVEQSRVAFIDLNQDKKELQLFINRPYEFDGKSAEKIMGYNNVTFKFLPDGIEEIYADTYDFEIPQSKEMPIMPYYECDFPYALFNKHINEIKKLRG